MTNQKKYGSLFITSVCRNLTKYDKEKFILANLFASSSPQKLVSHFIFNIKDIAFKFCFFFLQNRIYLRNTNNSKTTCVAPTHLVFLNHVVRVDTLNQIFCIWTILSAFLPWGSGLQNRDYKRKHGSNQVLFL